MTISFKRISKEYSDLVTSFTLDFKISSDDSHHRISFPLKSNNGTVYDVHIIMTHNYPFSCPIATVNNVNYISILSREHSIKLSEKCLCCASFLCPDKWKPVFKLENIINEIVSNINSVETLLHHND
jgi:ubiquitin-protein ligase